MNIPSIGSGSPITRLQGSTAVTKTGGSQDANSAPQDTVEISDTARYLNEIKKLPEIRQDKVNTARAAIAAGTYETPERIDGTVSALLRQLA